jgi:histidinol-phosphate aminotransferase
LLYLHLGENPYGPTPHVLQAMLRASENANRYPDTNAVELRERIAQYVGCGVTANNIILGNGSDELIDLAALTFATPADTAVTFEPSFFVYRFACQRHRIPVLQIPRNEGFDLPAALNPIQARQPIALSFIANPNNPTGTLTSREHLLRWVDELPGIVVVDECYFEFCGQTVADRVRQCEKLIVLRSFSKGFGCSGLRLGYAVAHESLIDALERYAMTFPVNAIAQAAGIAALEDLAAYRERVQKLIRARETLRRSLEALGLEVLPSQTNFLLAIFPAGMPVHPAQALAEKGILISDQTAAVQRERPALRLGIGAPEENERLLNGIQELLA